jgi:lysozyme
MRDTIFDISHWQGLVDFSAAKAAGMEAVICKATQGLSSIDTLFAHNTGKAQAAGLLVGAYHFGTDADGAAQADHFLELVGESCLVPVLDFEQNASQMLFTDALQFILTVREKTGIWPVVYCDRSHASVLAGSKTIVENCSLWLAAYRDLGDQPGPPAGWAKGYDLWQHEQDGRVAGVEGSCDRDAFMGDDLQAWWREHSVNSTEGGQ